MCWLVALLACCPNKSISSARINAMTVKVWNVQVKKAKNHVKWKKQTNPTSWKSFSTDNAKKRPQRMKPRPLFKKGFWWFCQHVTNSVGQKAWINRQTDTACKNVPCGFGSLICIFCRWVAATQTLLRPKEFLKKQTRVLARDTTTILGRFWDGLWLIIELFSRYRSGRHSCFFACGYLQFDS